MDIIARGGYFARREQPQGLFAVGLDIHKVFSDEQGDIGTLLLQPYVVRRDNQFARPISEAVTTRNPNNVAISFRTLSSRSRWSRVRNSVGRAYSPKRACKVS